MLGTNSLSAAISLATKLADRNLVVLPIGGTPVAGLVNASYTPLPINTDLNLDPAELLVQGANTLNQQGVSEHDVVMDEVVNQVVDTVNRNMDLARNVVKPMVKAVLDEAENHLALLEKTSAGRYQVSQDIWPSIYANPALADMVSRYKEQAVQQARLDLIVPAPADPAGLQALARTGASRFDGEVDAFFAGLPAGFAEKAYADFFTEIGAEYQGDLIAHLNPLSTDRRKVLLAHLYSRKLLNEIPEGVNRSADAYREYMSVIVNQSGRALARLLDRREADRKLQQLVVPGTMSPGVTTIQVNSDVYLEWLKSGGCPEILYGSAVTDREVGYKALLEKHEYYKASWTKNERTLQTALRLQRRNNVIDGLSIAMTRQITDLAAEHKVVMSSDYRSKLAVELQSLPNDFDQKLYHTARKLVCRVLFPHTDALTVLEAIDRAAEENPGIDVREAGYLALIELVGGWIGDLLRIEAVPAGL